MSAGKEVEDYLREIYYDPSHPAGYGSVRSLYLTARKKGLKITLTKVKQWLESQDTYTLHKPARRKFRRNRVFVFAMDSQWEADLVDLQSLNRQNNGYKYLLTCIDVLSKYAWVIPLKDKRGVTLIQAFKKILSSGRTPVRLFTDKGTEFKNRDFQKLLRSKGIGYFMANNETKCSIVERFNRTLKTKMWKYFTNKNTTKYIEILPKLVTAYNNAKHRSIGTSPASVNLENQMEIKKKLYGEDVINQPVKFKFKEGERVRISKTKMTFEKGYRPNWTEEVFVISKCVKRRPPVYRIKDLDGEELEGTFYEKELQKVEKGDDALYILDKVIKQRKRGRKTEYFVSWRGYPSKFNSWVSDIQLGTNK